MNESRFNITNLTVTASVGKNNNMYVIPKSSENANAPYSIFNLATKGIEACINYEQNGETTEEFLVIKEVPDGKNNNSEATDCDDFVYEIKIEDKNWIDIMFDDKSKSIVVYQVTELDTPQVRPKCSSTDSLYVSRITTLLYTVNLSIKKYVKIKVSTEKKTSKLELTTP